jgi:hypothetical protein
MRLVVSEVLAHDGNLQNEFDDRKGWGPTVVQYCGLVVAYRHLRLCWWGTKHTATEIGLVTYLPQALRQTRSHTDMRYSVNKPQDL